MQHSLFVVSKEKKEKIEQNKKLTACFVIFRQIQNFGRIRGSTQSFKTEILSKPHTYIIVYQMKGD